MHSLNKSTRELREMISFKDYTELKPYWDYQRKIEFNKEQLKDKLQHIIQDLDEYNNELVTDERDLIDIDQDELLVHFWNMIDLADMEDPPRAWIPKNKVYQVEGELEGRLLK